MPLDTLAKAIECSRRGAARAASHQADQAELTEVAELLGQCLENEDEATLAEVERRVRTEAPEALPWFLSILRTLAGTSFEHDTLQHLVLIPALARGAGGRSVPLGSAADEIAGALESALDLGYGSLKLLPEVAPLGAIETLTPCVWRRILEGDPEVEALLGGKGLSEDGGVLIGRWAVKRSDKARLARKLVHAMQRSRKLAAWQRRTEALLEGQAPGARFSIYPVMQLQDFFSGMRQIRLVYALEGAFRELPEAHALNWEWIDAEVRCTLSDASGRKRLVEGRFPDEPRELAQTRIAAFCARRGVFALPELETLTPQG